MNTHVIILAQGTQKRMGNLSVAKQMLRLPACGDVPILYRTLHQLRSFSNHYTIISVVCWLDMSERLIRERELDGLPLRTATLEDPGNSSLKGISRFLERSSEIQCMCDRTIVLLGDVVYSWACLKALFDGAPPYRFCGTSDLSPSGGELWGLSWRSTYDPGVMEALQGALNNHPKFTEYQPGQLRRWLYAFSDRFSYPHNDRTAVVDAPWYHKIDDYTRDIDLPEHLSLLPSLGESAVADDKEHGIVW